VNWPSGLQDLADTTKLVDSVSGYLAVVDQALDLAKSLVLTAPGWVTRLENASKNRRGAVVKIGGAYFEETVSPTAPR